MSWLQHNMFQDNFSIPWRIYFYFHAAFFFNRMNWIVCRDNCSVFFMPTEHLKHRVISDQMLWTTWVDDTLLVVDGSISINFLFYDLRRKTFLPSPNRLADHLRFNELCLHSHQLTSHDNHYWYDQVCESMTCNRFMAIRILLSTWACCGIFNIS